MILGLLEKMNIGKKLTLIMLLVSLVPLFFSGYFSYRYSKEIVISNTLSGVESDVKARAFEISSVLQGYGDNIMFLANIPPVQGIIRAKSNDGIDPVDNSTKEEWIERLEVIFEEIAKTNKSYLQVRYLDETGQELVRVDSDNEGVFKVPKEQLQNKGDRYYFTETMETDKGELFVSPLDLNQEGSPPEIEVPYKPVVRYGTPVFNEITGESGGIIIINIKAQEFLDLFSSNLKEEKTLYSFVDKEGYYFLTTDKNKEWGGPRDLNTGENIKKDFPESVYNSILSGKSNVMDVKDYGYVLSYYPVYSDANDREDFWVILGASPREIILASVVKMRNLLLLIGLGFGLISLFLSLVFSKTLSKPIKALSRGSEIIQRGNLDYRVGTDSKDEIGQLSRSFDKMTTAIKKSRAEVDQKVYFQTKDIIVKQKTLEDQQRAILNILEDVEEEKEATKEERDKIDIVLHSIGDGVFVVDRDLRITMINKVALDLCKCSGDPVGHKYGEVLKFISEKTGKTNDKFIVDALKTGKIQEMMNHTALVRKDGTKVPVADSSAPFKDKKGNIIGCVVVFRDVSKEREIEKMKTEFVSIASHQLRTPLTSISWFTEMLLGSDVGKINKQQKDYLEQVYESNQRMIRLVNDLLNVSRIETGKMVIKPELTQLEDLIQSVINESQALTKPDEIKISFKKPAKKLVKIKLDASLIRQVIQNLISNGIRYNKKKGDLKVKIEKIDKDILITVADTGIGIPKVDQRKMFLKFFRADNAIKRQADGNGLGLYINKSIIEAAGGKIWFESKEGEGTIFYITIPVSGMKLKKGTRSLIN